MDYLSSVVVVTISFVLVCTEFTVYRTLLKFACVFFGIFVNVNQIIIGSDSVAVLALVVVGAAVAHAAVDIVAVAAAADAAGDENLTWKYYIINY